MRVHACMVLGTSINAWFCVPALYRIQYYTECFWRTETQYTYQWYDNRVRLSDGRDATAARRAAPRCRQCSGRLRGRRTGIRCGPGAQLCLYSTSY